MAHAAARILIHDLDQLLDRVPAVADDVTGRAPCRGDQFAVHHQQTMIVTLQEGLDDHRSRMLACHGKALRYFLVRRESDGDAAAMIAVVGLGHDRKSDAPRGADRLLLVLHQFLFRHRQAERRQYLVGFLLVARQLDRDVRCAAGDRRLDALLVFAVAQLHQRLVIEAQPGDAVPFRRTHQCGRRRPERAALREADELIARLLPTPIVGHGVGRPDRRGQERTQQLEPELARGDALVALRIFVDDGIDPGRSGSARLAEGDFLARHVLQFDGDVLEHMPEPGAVVFAHAPKETAGLSVRAAVLRKPGQRGRERIDELRPQAAGGPRFERAQVEFEANDGKMRVQRRADIDGTIDNAHGRCSAALTRLSYSFAWTRPPAAASRVCRLNVAPATRMCNRSPSMQTGWPSPTSLMDE